MSDTPSQLSKLPPKKKGRDQSTIQFPYGDLDDAVSVATGIMKRGGVPLDADQLAASLGQAPTSGNFRMKIHTARVFGIIETIQGKYQLTDLGFAVVDKAREKAARAEAFLKVPLYRKVFEEFRNKQLPPRTAPLEHALVGFGVAPKQKERARQALERSAMQAGYFDHGSRDRLVRPATSSLQSVGSEESAIEGAHDDDRGMPDRSGAGNGGSGPGVGRRIGKLHPFIQGLLDALPEPETTWTVEGRAKWLQAAANIFDLMYKGEGDISIKASGKDRATG